MSRMKAAAAALLALTLLAGPHPAFAKRSGRTARLEEGAAREGSLRTVFFVEGMSCRACTMILDRRLAEKEGVYWARFNYPLRLFTVYHDPVLMSVEAIGGFVSEHEELDAVLLESRPAADAFTPDGDIAVWKGGRLRADETSELPAGFEKGLKDYMIDEGMSEWYQVIYEITGEEVRNRILKIIAKEKGYSGSGGTKLPYVIAKDFYWPSDRLDPTPDESAMAKFVIDEILGGSEGNDAIQRFDAWLLAFYRESKFDFRGENLELGEKP